MLFIGVALVFAIGLALLIVTDAGTLIGVSQTQLGQALPLLIILVLFAGSFFARRRQFPEMLRSLIAWVGIFAVALIGYSYRDDLMTVAGRVFGELRPGVAIVDAQGGTVSFRRGMGGHFVINAEINGHDLPLIFDTGASAVVLTVEDANAAGIDTASLNYSVRVSTANGTGRAAVVTLDQIVIGPIVRKRVRAFIAEHGALETSLLGMTFLETLERYSVSSDQLELID
ncbi:MAG: hypothetical protein JWR75_1917 [Devosia sp.]|nr:hypothetical protein [Devosia sp.]